MAISRTNPKILGKKYGLKGDESIWLTGKEIHGDMRSVLPILEFIMSIIEEFMEENTEGVVILDGLEYLLTNNKFNSVLRFLRQLVDNVSQTECILLVSLSPDALDQTEVTLLEKDLLPINYLS
jgi:archaellum biogenesis ATPase FlaH